MEAFWSPASYRAISEMIDRCQPDLAHFHNIWPMISPAGYDACNRAGITVVQTMHNYRLMCPAATFFRDGAVCELCLGKRVQWPAVRYGCYRGSRVGSAVLTAVNAGHTVLGTWKDKVDAYIALTEFAKGKLVQGGVPADQIVIKPNFLSEDLGVGSRKGGYAVFIGRLAKEKGVETLIAAWRKLQGVNLIVVGSGPLESRLRSESADLPGIQVLGARPREEAMRILKDALFLVVPSLWYEGFPMVVVEAYSAGIPVVASRIGSLSEVVHHERTGMHFEPGDPHALAGAVREMINAGRLADVYSRNARSLFVDLYAPDKAYERLVGVYEQASNTGTP